MQYEAETSSEHLDLLEDDWRKDILLQLRDILQSKGQELEEGIK